MKRTFVVEGKTFAPADFEEMNLSYDFQLSSGKALATARIDFRATSDGFPYFLSGPALLSVQLDGINAPIETRRDPDNLNSLRVIRSDLNQGDLHRLELTFEIPGSRLSLRPEGVGFLTTMSDIGSGNYFEAYAPSNFENDSYQLSLSMKLTGGSPQTHSLFANGSVSQTGAHSWRIEFPAYFTSSSFYIHLTDTPIFVKHGSYQGREALIPITVYSRENELAEEGMRRLPTLFSELESTYGPYAHESFIAYISGRGGMEHAGATITSLSALGHELTHSWFARGVMPSDGRSGWIDEAVASWRDNGYFRARNQFARAPTNLARASAFQRFTPSNSYYDGRMLLSELDLLLADQGGLRPLLGKYFTDWKRKTITTNGFRDFLERESGFSLQHHFQTYVYGSDPGFAGDIIGEAADDSLHPPPLTEKEILWLR
jgi:hypothetical protein